MGLVLQNFSKNTNCGIRIESLEAITHVGFRTPENGPDGKM